MLRRESYIFLLTSLSLNKHEGKSLFIHDTRRKEEDESIARALEKIVLNFARKIASALHTPADDTHRQVKVVN